MLHRNIDRLNAEDDIRLTEIHLRAAGDKETVTDLLKDLRKRMGTVVEFERQTPDPTKIERSSRKELMELKALGDLTKHVYPSRTGA